MYGGISVRENGTFVSTPYSSVLVCSLGQVRRQLPILPTLQKQSRSLKLGALNGECVAKGLYKSRNLASLKLLLHRPHPESA